MGGQPTKHFTFVPLSPAGGTTYVFDINPSNMDLPYSHESNIKEPLDGVPFVHTLKNRIPEGVLEWESILADQTYVLDSLKQTVGYTGLLVKPTEEVYFGISNYYSITVNDYEQTLKQTHGQVRYNFKLYVSVLAAV